MQIAGWVEDSYTDLLHHQSLQIRAVKAVGAVAMLVGVMGVIRLIVIDKTLARSQSMQEQVLGNNIDVDPVENRWEPGITEGERTRMENSGGNRYWEDVLKGCWLEYVEGVRIAVGEESENVAVEEAAVACGALAQRGDGAEEVVEGRFDTAFVLSVWHC